MLTNTISIKQEEFLELADIIYKSSDLSFPESKKYLIETRLSKRLQQLNITSFKDYIYYLKYNPDRAKELTVLTNLVTTNETFFFRERPQIDYLVKNVIPAFAAKGKTNIKILSSACSSGEEPYSIVMAMLESGMIARCKPQIFATDINTEVLKIAEKGEFKDMSFRGVLPAIKTKYFTKDGFSYKISDEIKRYVKFSQGNMTEYSSYIKFGKVDVIFCRNAIIYLDVNGKRKTVENFSKCLDSNGYLFLGHSETLKNISDAFQLNKDGNVIYYTKA